MFIQSVFIVCESKLLIEFNFFVSVLHLRHWPPLHILLNQFKFIVNCLNLSYLWCLLTKLAAIAVAILCGLKVLKLVDILTRWLSLIVSKFTSLYFCDALVVSYGTWKRAIPINENHLTWIDVFFDVVFSQYVNDIPVSTRVLVKFVFYLLNSLNLRIPHVKLFCEMIVIDSAP